VAELNLGPVSATARHHAVGTLWAEVEDLSLMGLALVFAPAEAPQMILVGDRLEELRLECVGGAVTAGTAMVRRIGERGGRVVLGVELESQTLDLGDLVRRGTRRSFAERWAVIENDAQQTTISTEFKAWVTDLRVYLEATQRFLDGEEAALAAWDRYSRELALEEFLAVASAKVVARMDAAARDLGPLVGHLTDAEHQGYRGFLRAQLGELLGQSPFMRRAQEKPLGYAGDYEMMNMLYREHAEGPSLFARALNVYATGESAARANINRIRYLDGRIRAAVDAAPAGTRVRVASIGCGPAREVLEVLTAAPELGARLDVALIDQEERSIAYCERTLGPLAARTGARLRFIRESVRRLLTTRGLGRALGERELVYSAGLFDYLNDRTFGALLKSLYDVLVPGGLLAVGNVARDNPSRWAMEYFGDWFLIHRAREDLEVLGAALVPAPAGVAVESEPLGVNLFLVVRR
jgi:extracellular factor (EF) 3-hydroxypalmitic acid methyl ester biosynthesis protein